MAEPIKNHDLDNKIKYNIFLIVKETINNCAKYSQATMVTINIVANSGWFSLKIKDNGVGFDQSAYGVGNGLSNIRKRAEEINATIKITSVKNEGTSILLRLKIK